MRLWRRDPACHEGKAAFTLEIDGLPNGMSDEGVNYIGKHLPGYRALYCMRRQPNPQDPNDPPAPYELEGKAYMRFASNLEAWWAKACIHGMVMRSGMTEAVVSAHWAHNETRIPRQYRDPGSRTHCNERGGSVTHDSAGPSGFWGPHPMVIQVPMIRDSGARII